MQKQGKGALFNNALRKFVFYMEMQIRSLLSYTIKIELDQILKYKNKNQKIKFRNSIENYFYEHWVGNIFFTQD